MKCVCSQCGEFFDGVYCPNCRKKAESAPEEPTVITVSLPERELDNDWDEEETPVSKKSRKALERQRRRADKAAMEVEELEEKNEPKPKEKKPRKQSKLFHPFLHICSLSAKGETRQAIHYAVSPKGYLASVFLLPLCAIIPLCGAVAYVCLHGAALPVRPDEAVSSFISQLKEPFFKALLFWFELFASMVVFLRAHAFAIKSPLRLPAALTLALTAQLPALLISPVFVVSLLLVPPLSIFLALLSCLQAIILIYIGVEFAAREIKRGVFTSFSVMLGLYICVAAGLAALNYDSAAEYIFGLLSKTLV